MKKLYPVVIDGLNLEFCEASSEEEALMTVATTWVEGIKVNNPAYEARIDPKGVTSCTPNKKLKVLLKTPRKPQEEQDVVFVIPFLSWSVPFGKKRDLRG